MDPINSELLAGFLGGTQVTEDRENGIAVCIKLLGKTNETTKIKALTDLISRVRGAREEALLPFVLPILDIVRTHVDHESSQLRIQLFQLLQLVASNKQAKAQIAQCFGSLLGPWLHGMNDIEPCVRQSAVAAFEGCFAEDKRLPALQRYATDAVAYVLDSLGVLAAETKPLLDDAADPRANVVYACFGALSQVMRAAPAAHKAILDFVSGPAFAKAFAPHKNPGKSSLLLRCPRARSSVLSLLRDVVELCPMVDKRHDMVISAVTASLGDSDATVALKLWELLVTYLRKYTHDAVARFPPKFLDAVIDVVMACEVPEVLQVHLRSLMPFVALVSKDPRVGVAAIDEYCGALVEKCAALCDTPNTTAADIASAWACLMECWELHAVRKRDADSVIDSLELFAVILHGMVQVAQVKRKAQRFLQPIAKVVAASLKRACVRDTTLTEQLLATLTHRTEVAHFVAIPDDNVLPRSSAEQTTVTAAATDTTAVSDRLKLEQVLRVAASAVLGEMLLCVADTAALQEAVHAACDHCVRELVLNKEWDSLLSVAHQAGTSHYVPAEGPVVASAIFDSVKKEVTRTDDGNALSEATMWERLLHVAMRWTPVDQLPQAVEPLQGVAVPWVKRVVQQAVASDPALLLSCLVGQLSRSEIDPDDVLELGKLLSEKVAQHVQLQQKAQAELRAAVRRGVESLESEVFAAENSAAFSLPSSSRTSSNELEDGDDEDNSSASASAAEGAAHENKGSYYASLIVGWTVVLAPDSSVGCMLGWDARDFCASRVPELLLRVAAAIAPALRLEQVASEQCIRLMAAAADADESDDESSYAFVMDCLDVKRHAVKVDVYGPCKVSVEGLLAAYRVPDAECERWVGALLQEALRLENPGSLGGVSSLSSFLFGPTADRAAAALLSSEVFWGAHQILVRPQSHSGEHFDGEVRLSGVISSPQNLTSVVRTAQLIRLLDATNMYATVPLKEAPLLLRQCLVATSTREVFADAVHHALVHRVAVALLQRCCVEGSGLDPLVDGLQRSWHLVATAAKLLRVVADSGGAQISIVVAVSTGELIGAIARFFLTAASESGARSVLHCLEHCYHIAVAIRRDVLFDDVAPALILERLQQVDAKTSVEYAVALLGLARLHRDKLSLPDATAKHIMTLANTARSVDGLILLGELMCGRILNRNLLLDLVRQTTAALAQAYPLHHLPSNGRLGQRSPSSPGLPVPALFGVVRGCLAVLRALRYHDVSGDVLKSSAQLVLFDVICEGVSRLQPSKAAALSDSHDVGCLMAALAACHEHVSEISASDVAPLRSSEKSIATIASVFTFAYQWVAVVSPTKLDAIGRDNVRLVINSVCALAFLAMMRLRCAQLPPCLVESILRKPAGKPLRKQLSDFTSVEPQKLARFRQYHDLLRKANKQKLVLQVTWLAWAIVASHENESGHRVVFASFETKELRHRTYDLLDQLLSVSLAPLHPERRKQRMEEGALFTPAEDGDTLGYDIASLAHVDGNDSSVMAVLARGGVSLVPLLLQNTTLGIVKDWMETIDKRLREAFTVLVQDHISPALIQASLVDVLSHSPDGKPAFDVNDNVKVSVNLQQQAVDVLFQMDEIEVKICICLPTTYPMKPASVTQGDSASAGQASQKSQVQGISSDRWRSWILKMSAKLFNGSCSLWDCVELFEQNIKRHFDGVEPCPICYAVVSAANNKLPEMRCAVCRNSLFHSSCLNTWWGNTGQTSCPMCRSPWVSQ